MHAEYTDILERISTEPLWWDEYAVPRYCEFSPRMMANIYAQEAVLLLISCAFGPLHHFKVAISQPQPGSADLASEILNRIIHYGDPPRGQSCRDGDTSSVPIRVLQYWRKTGTPWPEWVRNSSLEIDVLASDNEEYRDPSQFGKRPVGT